MGGKFLLQFFLPGDVADQNQHPGDGTVFVTNRRGQVINVEDCTVGQSSLALRPAAVRTGIDLLNRASLADGITPGCRLVATQTQYFFSVEFACFAIAAADGVVPIKLPHGGVHDINQIGQGPGHIVTGRDDLACVCRGVAGVVLQILWFHRRPLLVVRF